MAVNRGSFRNYLRDRTLLQRLLIAEGLVFTFMVVATLIAAQWFTDGLRDGIREERTHTTLSFAGRLDQALSDSFLVLDTIAQSGVEQDRLAQQVALESKLFTRGVFFVDGSGLVTRSFTTERALDGADLSGAIATADAGNAGRLGWGFRAEPAELPVIALAVPLARGSDGWVIGMADTLDSAFSAIALDAKRIGETTHADVIDSRAMTVISTEYEHHLEVSDHPTFYREAIAAGQSGIVEVVPHEAVPADDSRHLMGFAELEVLPWAVALGGDVTESFGPIDRLWKTVLGLIGAVGAISFTATVFGTSRLVAPVRGLSDSARDVAAGSLGDPIATETGGEIGDLAQSIETMRQALHSWGVELDERVEHRTAALTASAAVARATASSVDLDTMLETAASEIEQHLAVDGAVITVFAAPGRGEVIRGSAGVPKDLPLLATPCRYCTAARNEWSDRWQDTEHAAADPPCADFGYRATLTAPITSQDRQIGSLCLLRRDAPDGADAPEVDLSVVKLLASQVAIGIENAGLYAGLRWRDEQRQQLLAKVLTAQEEERRRIARELHDETGQAFIGLILAFDGLINSGVENSDATLAQIARLRAYSEESLQNLRNMVLALRPSALDDLGLVAAVERYADFVVRDAGITVELVTNIGPDRLQRDLETVVFRVVQESLNNVVRHSGATTASVTMDARDSVLDVAVADNGRGFSDDASQDGLVGVGLEGMRERAVLVGGDLTVESERDQGTTVRLRVPLER